MVHGGIPGPDPRVWWKGMDNQISFDGRQIQISLAAPRTETRHLPFLVARDGGGPFNGKCDLPGYPPQPQVLHQFEIQLVKNSVAPVNRTYAPAREGRNKHVWHMRHVSRRLQTFTQRAAHLLSLYLVSRESWLVIWGISLSQRTGSSNEATNSDTPPK